MRSRALSLGGDANAIVKSIQTKVGNKTVQRWLLTIWVILVILLLILMLAFDNSSLNGPLYPLIGAIMGGISSVSVSPSILYELPPLPPPPPFLFN